MTQPSHALQRTPLAVTLPAHSRAYHAPIAPPSAFAEFGSLAVFAP